MSNPNRISVKIKFFATLKDVFDSNDMEYELKNGGTIRELLEKACDSEERRHALFNDSGEIKPYFKVLKNGRSIDFLNGVDTRLADGDILSIFPPLAGG